MALPIGVAAPGNDWCAMSPGMRPGRNIRLCRAKGATDWAAMISSPAPTDIPKHQANPAHPLSAPPR